MDGENSKENNYATTPLKSVGNSLREQLLSKGGNPYKTPIHQNRFNSTGGELKSSRTKTFKSVVIKKMPTYSPPSKSVSYVKNPFEHAKLLKERLSQPVCSPSLFKAVSSPAQNDDFTWSIEDISMLHPADIDENPSQDFDSWFSPVTESEAQEAINKFFSSRLADMDSPLDVEIKKRPNRKREEKDTPGSFTDAATQTNITLPPILPPDLEALLKRYCVFGEDDHRELCADNSEADTPTADKKPLLLYMSICQTPEGKIPRGTHVSTPVTSRLSSPDISPVGESSPMDVSIRDKSYVRLNLTKDIAVCEKEMSNDWNCQGCSTPNRAATQSCDSAFSSM